MLDYNWNRGTHQMDLVFVLGIGILRIFQSSFNKQSSKYLPSVNQYLRFGLYFEASAAIFALIYLFINGFYGLNALTLACSAFMGTMFLLELTTSIKALQNAPLALCTICALGGGIILPSISGIFFFNEPMTIWKWFGVALFFVSAYFLSPYEKKRLSIKKSTALILMLNFIINGFCGTISKFFSVKVENGNAAMFACLSYAFAAVLFSAVLLVVGRKPHASHEASERFLPKPVYFFGGAVGAVCASIVFFTTVLSKTVSIIVLNTVPNTICLVGCLLIDAFLFRAKLNARQIIGAVLNVLATTVIVLF